MKSVNGVTRFLQLRVGILLSTSNERKNSYSSKLIDVIKTSNYRKMF